jgi:hypothetical protein
VKAQGSAKNGQPLQATNCTSLCVVVMGTRMGAPSSLRATASTLPMWVSVRQRGPICREE